VIQSKEEKKMKITTIVKVSVYAATLGFAFMLPVTAHAQMDVSPDEFPFSAPATTHASGLITGHFESGQKAKVKGVIKSRNGDLVNVKDSKTGSIVGVSITDSTQIERKKGAFKFRKSDMDVTAMVPGLGVEAEGVGNSKGQLDVLKITFSPDDFAIEVAEEQQIEANQAAAQKAQSTANKGVSGAQTAQSSANQAQVSANQAAAAAGTAGAIGVMDAAAISKVNQRVSDLGDYSLVAEAGIYYASDKSALDDAAKADLSALADLVSKTNGYMIEIAGYASSTGTKEENQKLSGARAAAVTDYLRNVKNIPMRRILVPAGYGASHPAGENTDAQGRAENRRVDVKVLVNKGINEQM
jgi:outer membrane protein OmpA-like peptidoglycan-associated protein